jgi:glycosyltransferase involved in cell wall biosynthesis
MAAEDSGVIADLRFTPTEEFVGAMLRADVVVLPYRRIDQSGVLFAALALGRPLVATRVGGFAEVVEQYGAGLVVPPENPAALAEALIEVLRDPARRDAMAAASRAAADGPFSWDAIAAATEQVYAS